MAAFMEVLNWVMANWQNVLVAVNAVLASLIALFLFIPGDQPEKFLQSCVDFLAKFSKK